MTTATETPRAQTVDMKLEVVVIPVSDVDRAKRFYGDLGWRLDLDYAAGDDFRVIQFTPPGSGCSVIFVECRDPSPRCGLPCRIGLRSYATCRGAWFCRMYSPAALHKRSEIPLV